MLHISTHCIFYITVIITLYTYIYIYTNVNTKLQHYTITIVRQCPLHPSRVRPPHIQGQARGRRGLQGLC